MEVELESVRICDMFGIFYINRSVRSRASVKIMPELRLMPLEITRAVREFRTDSDEYSGEKKGDDPSELFQVREYRVQDSVRDIHWKLSAKEEELMVKEHGLPLGMQRARVDRSAGKGDVGSRIFETPGDSCISVGLSCGAEVHSSCSLV